jgi:hypothetical protein
MPGLHSLWAIWTSGLLALGPPDGVPVQRPAALQEAPAVEAAAHETPEPRSGERGRIEGVARDAEAHGRELAGVRVELLCSCLPDALVTLTDAQGRFSFDDLPAGEYTVFADRGGEVATRLLALPEGAIRSTALQVPPPFPTALREQEQRELARGRAMVSVGGVAAATAVFLLISAGVEAAKPPCRFGPDACENPPRPNLIGAFAGVGAALLLGGSTLVVAGARRIRRVDARLVVDGRRAGLSVSGRF